MTNGAATISERPAETPDPDVGRRYTTAAIVLHWTIAALILFQIAYAWWWMGKLNDHSPAHAAAMVTHMSIGLTVLLLSLARLAVRFTVALPHLPASMAPWERLLARASHLLFYVLMIGIPLTGWALASMRPSPIPFWGLFTWPHLPFMQAFAGAARRQVSHPLGLVHTSILIWSTLVLLVLHVAGALKHQFGPSPVLWRMLPGARRL